MCVHIPMCSSCVCDGRCQGQDDKDIIKCITVIECITDVCTYSNLFVSQAFVTGDVEDEMARTL